MRIIRTVNGHDVEVDDSDFESLSKQRWTAVWDPTISSYYARSTSGDRNVLMHRTILGVTSAAVLVDHLDHHTLNNQRYNIRACSPSQNQWNRRPNKSTRSGLKGVYWNRGKWLARIKVHHKNVFLGRFSDPKEAHQAYCVAAHARSSEFLLTS